MHFQFGPGASSERTGRSTHSPLSPTMTLAPRLAGTLLFSGSFAAAGLAAAQDGRALSPSPLALLLPATAACQGGFAALPARLEAAADRWVPEGVVS